MGGRAEKVPSDPAQGKASPCPQAPRKTLRGTTAQKSLKGVFSLHSGCSGEVCGMCQRPGAGSGLPIPQQVKSGVVTPPLAWKVSKSCRFCCGLPGCSFSRLLPDIPSPEIPSPTSTQGHSQLKLEAYSALARRARQPPTTHPARACS